MHQASNSIEMNGPLHSVMPDVLAGLAASFGGWISWVPTRQVRTRSARPPATRRHATAASCEGGGERRGGEGEEGRGGEKNPGDGGLTRRRRKENDDN